MIHGETLLRKSGKAAILNMIEKESAWPYKVGGLGK